MKTRFLDVLRALVNWRKPAQACIAMSLCFFTGTSNAAACNWRGPPGANTYTDVNSEVIGTVVNGAVDTTVTTETVDCGSFTVATKTWFSAGTILQPGVPRESGKDGILVRASAPTAYNPWTKVTYTGTLSDLRGLAQAYVDGSNAIATEPCIGLPLTLGNVRSADPDAWPIYVQNGQSEVLANYATQGPIGAVGGAIRLGMITVIRNDPGCPGPYAIYVYSVVLERIAPLDQISELVKNVSSTYRRICEAPRTMNGGQCELPAGAIDPKKNLGESCTDVGNPCNAATGNKHQREDDYVGLGVSPLQFTRSYNSQPTQLRALGGNWVSNFDKSVTQSGDTTATVFRGNGKQFVFRWIDSKWVGDSDGNGELLGAPKSSDGWVYFDRPTGMHEWYDAMGKLTSTRTRSGHYQNYIYRCVARFCDTADSFRLESVSGHGARKLSFEYDDHRRLVKMRDPTGAEFSYAYWSAGPTANLKSVTYPDGATKTYLYAEPERISAGSSVSVEHLLTGIIDENNIRFASWNYDSAGRAVSSEHGVGLDSVSLAYPAPNKTVVSRPQGVTETYAFSPVIGVLKPISLTRTGPNGVVLGTKFWEYDTHGNLGKLTNFDRTVTVFSYDSKNREISRTEAFGTVMARTITTAWHSSIGLPQQIAEPKRRTTYTYVGNGEIYARTVQATTDLNGASAFTSATVGIPRVWKYGYNAAWQVATVKGPATDDLTTYSYDALTGNLLTIKNALNHETKFEDYDANGRARSVTQPNGAKAQLFYSSRGWLEKMTVADGGITMVTGYEYDNVGQLKKVISPDGSTIKYTYDDARRLTDIEDSKGNKIHYVLDLQGNRISEQISDAQNILRQQLTREFDALNRVKVQTGGAQ